MSGYNFCYIVEHQMQRDDLGVPLEAPPDWQASSTSARSALPKSVIKTKHLESRLSTMNIVAEESMMELRGHPSPLSSSGFYYDY